jgi:hypothetical protein
MILKSVMLRYSFVKQNLLIMKKAIVCFIILLSSVVSFGQVSIGLSAGADLSTMSISLRDLSSFRIRPVQGYNAGLVADLKLNDNLSLWSGLYVTQKGFNQHIKYYYAPPRVDSTADMTIRITCIEIPVYLKFNTNMKKGNFFYGVGPYVSYAIQGNIKTRITGRDNESFTDKIKFDKIYDNINSDLVNSYGYTRIKRLDFGIGTMLGFRISNIILTASYRYGLHNLMWEYFQDEKMNNSSLSLSVGYMFHKNLQKNL